MNILSLLTAGALGAALGAALIVLIRKRPQRSADARSDRYPALLTEGLRHLVSGDRASGLESLERAGQLSTEDPRLFLVLGDLYREQGEPDRAALVHRTLLARRNLAPALHSAALVGLARDEERAGHPVEAEALLRKASREARKEPEPLVELGLLLEAQGRWEEAVEVARAVRRLDKDRGSTILARRYVTRALELLAGGNLKPARQALSSALDCRPGLSAAEIARGDLLFQEGQPERAAHTWEALLIREPERAHLVLDRLEEVHRITERPDDTRQLAVTLAERCPADWRLRAYLADVSIQAGDRDAADRWLDELSHLRPRSATLDLLLWRRSLAFGFEADRAKRRAANAVGPSRWADPFRCRRCDGEIAEFRWRCPSCRGWDTLE